MRQFFRMLLLGLVLVTVALVSALTAMRVAIHGREVAVPRVIGMTPLEAERAMAPSGLDVVVERQYYSPSVAEGRIMSQVPADGAKVRRGWSVRVAQSLGPQRVMIPDVTGESERVAELNVRRRGLDLGSMAQVNLADVAADQVASQSPPANASGVSVPKINLLVSRGPEPAAFVMPNFVGQPLGSVTLALQDAGIKLGKVSVAVAAAAPPVDVATAPAANVPPPLPGAASMIVTQSPGAGQKVMAGSAVSFEVR
jgi:beta-lactam-binding protein with PASTA domain